MMADLNSRSPIHQHIASAIVEGAGDEVVRSVRLSTRTDIYIRGHETPIRCFSDDVLVPDSLKEWTPGIRVDVQAVLSQFSDKIVARAVARGQSKKFLEEAGE